MLRVCVAELRKALLLVIEDRSAPLFLFVIPLIIVFFASFAVQGLITSTARYKLPVIDLDQSSGSESIVRALAQDGGLDVEVQRAVTFGQEDAAEVLGGGERIAALVIPEGAGAAIESGGEVVLPMYVDPTQDTRYGLMFLAVERALYRSVAPQVAVKIVADAAEMPEGAVAETVRSDVQALLEEPIVAVNTQAASRSAGVPNAYDQTVPGIALMWALSVFTFSVWMIQDERQIFRTWPRTLTTPASRLGLLLGRFLASYFYVATVVAFLFIIGALVFDMEFGQPTVLVVVVAVYAAVPAAIGTFMAVSGLDRQLAFLLGNVGMFVVGAVSGALVPLYVLPPWIERLAVISPLYWAKDAAQDVMIRGAGFADVVVPMLALAFITGLCLLAASVRLRGLSA